ncbi:MAG: tyrosine--tRNA ligase [candidate division KSB1 bacterium]|nr:tyrosine--tRNA ligase [candidate division KSB1 bacterium]
MSLPNVTEELRRRGFVKQSTDADELEQLLSKESVTFYIGFDPTADSLHVGHLLGIMAMTHMQRYGHRPIAIVGGGTAMIGDPSGKTEMRKMLSREDIEANTAKIKQQISRFIDFGNDKALLVDNWEWIGGLGFVEFLRDIGRHFSVNRMLSFETYKRRLETGLSFLEFNYQLLQAYDFLMLYRKYGCRLQMGGDDQWANILAGADLVRRVEGEAVYGHTFPLLTTASGAKMGKTESGALWLDASRTSPFDFYQYWINIDDRDVVSCLNYFTLLPIEEIEAVQDMQGVQYNIAKTVLAYEITNLVHGQKAADEAFSASIAAFGKREIPQTFLPSSKVPRGGTGAADKAIPSLNLSRSELESAPLLANVLCDLEMTKSRGEARRLIKQGGVYINGERVTDKDAVLKTELEDDGKIAVRLGKKKHYNLIIK